MVDYRQSRLSFNSGAPHPYDALVAIQNLWNEADPGVITGVLFAALLSAYLVGLMIGRNRPQDSQSSVGSRITDSTLALMGLLLGFSFAMALSKYDRRRDMVVNDANAIGDFYTCVCMLKDSPARAELQNVTREYVMYRLELGRGALVGAEVKLTAMERIAGMHQHMTDLVRQAINDNTAVAMPLVNTLNEVTSAHTARAMAIHDRLPLSIVMLLFLATAVSMGLLGWQQGAAGKKFCASTLWLVILIIASLYVTLDLNQPQRGLIRETQAPLEWLLRSMGTGTG